MKKLLVSLLVLPFLFSGVAAAQSRPHPTSENSVAARIVSLSGRLGDDGKSFLAKHGQVWTIANPDAVSGQAGQELKLKVQLVSAAHEIQVLAVKVVATQVRLVANPSDSAFHR